MGTIDCDLPIVTDDESVMVGEETYELCAAETKGAGDVVKFDGENAMVQLLLKTEVLWEIFS